MDHAQTRPDEINDRGSDVDVVVTNKVALREATLARLPALRLIVVAATGTDVVDVEWCRQHGVAVANIRRDAVAFRSLTYVGAYLRPPP